MPMNCAKAPCKSCPYRRDVPSGLWHEDEYDKLPNYDGSIVDQAMNGATSVFMCHQQDGRLCAGWVAAHNSELLALRLRGHEIESSVWDYKSPVPVFPSGKEAADHGKRDIATPSTTAISAIKTLERKQIRRKNKNPGR